MATKFLSKHSTSVGGPFQQKISEQSMSSYAWIIKWTKNQQDQKQS